MMSHAAQRIRLSVTLGLIAALTLVACGGGSDSVSPPVTAYSSTSICANGLALNSTVSQAAADALVPNACPAITASQVTALGFSVNTIGAGSAASSNVSLNNLPLGAILGNSSLELKDAAGRSYALAITVSPLKLTATPALPFATTFTVVLGSLNFTNLPGVSLLGKTVVTGPAPQAPLSVFSLSAAPYQVGDAINFNGAASSDADGTIASYAWSFGDGGAATGKTLTHSYSNPGTYLVSLTVTDDTGMVNINTASINVVAKPPPAPVVALSAPVAVISPAAGPVPVPADGYHVGLLIGFGGFSSSDSDGTIASYAWDFGDGATVAASSMSIAFHAYVAAGTYQVTLTVVDNSGLSNSVTKNFIVLP